MRKFFEFLDGKKSYLTAIAVIGVSAAEYLGKLTPEESQQLLAFLAGLGLITLRAAVASAVKKAGA
jgi:hypothetical protein